MQVHEPSACSECIIMLTHAVLHLHTYPLPPLLDIPPPPHTHTHSRDPSAMVDPDTPAIVRVYVEDGSYRSVRVQPSMRVREVALAVLAKSGMESKVASCVTPPPPLPSIQFSCANTVYGRACVRVCDNNHRYGSVHIAHIAPLHLASHVASRTTHQLCNNGGAAAG
jgi:hypothetical protein